MNDFPTVEQHLIIGWPNRHLHFTGEWRESKATPGLYAPVYRNTETGQVEIVLTMTVRRR